MNCAQGRQRLAVLGLALLLMGRAGAVSTISLLTYNVHGNGVADWSTNAAQVQAIGRQLVYLKPDIITFQEIPYTNTPQMTNFIRAFLPGYYLATNSVTDGFVRSAIASRFPITRSTSWLPHGSLTNFGYVGTFTRDLFEAEIRVPAFVQPLHVFTTHLKASQTADDIAKRAAEAAAISNFFVKTFLPANGNHPYVLTGDMNEDVQTLTNNVIPRIANPTVGLQLTRPLNPVTLSEKTYSIQSGQNPTARLDYILPGALLGSNILSSQVFRTDKLTNPPPPLLLLDDKTASDHLPVLMIFGNPYETPYEMAAMWISNQSVVVQWQAASNRSYRVDLSTNLMNWTAAGSNLAASGDFLTFATNLSLPRVFFRIYRDP